MTDNSDAVCGICVKQNGDIPSHVTHESNQMTTSSSVVSSLLCTNSSRVGFSSLEEHDDDVTQTVTSDETREGHVTRDVSGWRWVVCGASFVVHFLNNGVHLSFGIILLEIRSAFQDVGEHAVLTGSLCYGISLLVTSLVHICCRRINDLRYVTVLGSALVVLGCVAASFANNTVTLVLSCALAFGLGGGVSLGIADLMVEQYFTRRREIAEMLALTGSGAGMAIISVILTHLFRNSNWMRSLQTLAVVQLLNFIAAAIYQPITMEHRMPRNSKLAIGSCPISGALTSPSAWRLLLSTFIVSLGIYLPFTLLAVSGARAWLSRADLCLLLVLLGASLGFGCLFFSLLVARRCDRCVVARQYLVQLTAAGCGSAALILVLSRRFYALVLYVCVYGFMYGGYVFSLKVYAMELTGIGAAGCVWPGVLLTKAVGVICGVPLADLIGKTADSEIAAYQFSGLAMIVGSVVLTRITCKTNRNRANVNLSDRNTTAKHVSDSYNLTQTDQSDVDDDVASVAAGSRAQRRRNRNERSSSMIETIKGMTAMSPIHRVAEFLFKDPSSFSLSYHDNYQQDTDRRTRLTDDSGMDLEERRQERGDNTIHQLSDLNITGHGNLINADDNINPNWNLFNNGLHVNERDNMPVLSVSGRKKSESRSPTTERDRLRLCHVHEDVVRGDDVIRINIIADVCRDQSQSGKKSLLFDDMSSTDV